MIALTAAVLACVALGIWCLRHALRTLPTPENGYEDRFYTFFGCFLFTVVSFGSTLTIVISTPLFLFT